MHQSAPHSPRTLSVASLCIVDTMTAAFIKYSEKHSTPSLSKPVTLEMVRELLVLIPEFTDSTSDTMAILSLCLSRIVSPSLHPMEDARGELKMVQRKVTLAPATTTWEVGSMTNSGAAAREEVNLDLSLFNITSDFFLTNSVLADHIKMCIIIPQPLQLWFWLVIFRMLEPANLQSNFLQVV